MRYYEDKLVSYTTQELVKTICDICGAEAKQGEWRSSLYEINEVEIRVEVRQKEGSDYPEGGWGTHYQADICPNCFKNKLVPWLKSQGCQAKEEEWDW